MHVLPIGVFILAVVSIVVYSLLRNRTPEDFADVELRKILVNLQLRSLDATGSESVEKLQKELQGFLNNDSIDREERRKLKAAVDAIRAIEELRNGSLERRTTPVKSSRALQVRLLMQVIVSLVMLGAALYIILSPIYDPKDKHWAYGSAGTILGFWLKH